MAGKNLSLRCLVIKKRTADTRNKRARSKAGIQLLRYESDTIAADDLTMTMPHSGKTIEQMSGDTCPTARELSRRKRMLSNGRLILPHTMATSAATMKRPFSLKCRRSPRELELVKSVIRACRTCATSQITVSVIRELRDHPVRQHARKTVMNVIRCTP